MAFMGRRVFRYSFVRFIFLAGFFWTIFILYMATWNSKYFSNVVNQKFYDIDVQQMIQGKMIEVVERDLIKEGEMIYDLDNGKDEVLVNQAENEVDELTGEVEAEKLHVEINEEIMFADNESIVVIEPKLKTPADIPMPIPTLSPEILDLQRRLNLTNPGHLGEAVLLPANMEPEIERMLNKSKEKYQINEFVSNLIPLDRELPDIRTSYCKNKTYSDNLPMASVIMVFHNEAASMILRSVYAVLNRSPAHLLKEIILVDDCSDIGEIKPALVVLCDLNNVTL